MLWNYLRLRVRDTILSGVSDAMIELEGRTPASQAEALASLKRRLQFSPPSPSSATASEPSAASGKHQKCESGRRTQRL